MMNEACPSPFRLCSLMGLRRVSRGLPPETPVWMPLGPCRIELRRRAVFSLRERDDGRPRSPQSRMKRAALWHERAWRPRATMGSLGSRWSALS